MSVKEVHRFNEAVRNDTEMLKEVKAIGNDVEKIVQYANSKGFEFTVDDLKNLQSESGQLSDEDLDEVAGGIVVAVAEMIITVVGLAVVIN